MTTNQNLIHDLIEIAETLFNDCVGQSLQKKAERIAEKLELVNRSDFDAALAMIAKARQKQEALDKRLALLEAKLTQSRTRKTVKKAAASLRSVKHHKKRKASKN